MHRLAAVLIMCVVALNVSAQTQPSPSHPELDIAHIDWVHSVLVSIQTIKVGMTRGDLMGIFTTEGGVSSPSRRTYVYRQCPYIKIDVKFAPASGMELANDKIVEISRPYLEWSILD
jgi:hypothetical protein